VYPPPWGPHSAEAAAPPEQRSLGEPPGELGQLARLEEFVLFNNSLSGALPGELGLLSRLTRVHLASNRLSGPLPIGMSRLSKLQELNLFQNFLTGVPLQLSALSSLSTLTLSQNSLAGPFPLLLPGCAPCAAWRPAPAESQDPSYRTSLGSPTSPTSPFLPTASLGPSLPR